MKPIRIESGEDKFGSFSVFLDHETGKCDCCLKPVNMFVRYWSPDFGDGIQIGDRRLIIKSPRAKIGIGCGCLGKLHRQIVHIQERMKASG